MRAAAAPRRARRRGAGSLRRTTGVKGRATAGTARQHCCASDGKARGESEHAVGVEARRGRGCDAKEHGQREGEEEDWPPAAGVRERTPEGGARRLTKVDGCRHGAQLARRERPQVLERGKHVGEDDILGAVAHPPEAAQAQNAEAVPPCPTLLEQSFGGGTRVHRDGEKLHVGRKKSEPLYKIN